MAETLTTTLGAVLTHTTGRMLANLDEAWPLQDALLGRPLMTHERIAESNDVAPELLRQFPALSEADPPAGIASRETADALVRQVAAHIGMDADRVVVTIPGGVA